jgi:hypothetical protein
MIRDDLVEYEVVPHEGIGPIVFGMSREQSRAAMGTTPETFRKSGHDATETDAYHHSAFQVFFDKDIVEYIELSADESVTATYKGRNVFETKAQELVDLVSREAPYDPEDPELGYSYIFPKLELALWRPLKPESEDDPEGRYFSTIGIGRQGYFSARA